MKTFYLLRHAHAAPSGHTFSDHDRPLEERGRKEAEAMAHVLSEKEITFDFVMCSSALRAQETLEPLRLVIGTPAIDISEDFYNISEDKILDYLRGVSDEKEKVLYIGHNPGLALAILKFAKVFPSFLKESITPGTLVGFHFPFEKWADLEWGAAEMINLLQP
jgi:phosphohistidine phosphatase